ncbi:hypothetical protein G8O24_18785 [Bradyrhizobium sp. INPA01-394B]|uniref:Uncharacterized protein n=1 Tax=Bradyrhizobium campsiandrae TaxID=1729892 RepID=A0ABR7UIU4_9BRAD|nr:hypothetical protein [Bradyrhizobium campsiandrae]MBC9879390.1 hypothetical protein [Bradyrhizobium campsiandrae]MBC9983337.1 hypothetical protein [Bradyrhizobium campsiandrae]
MIKQSLHQSNRYLWRLLSLLLIVIPFLPEIVIVSTAAVAEIMGWDQKGVCTIYSLPLTKIITFALEAAASSILAVIRTDAKWLPVFYAGVSAWLCLCLITIYLGWASPLSRLLLGFAAALAFAFLPYLGPMLAIASLMNDNCQPNEAGIGSCVVFGGYIGNAEYSPVHDAVAIGWLASYGVPLAFGILGIYAIAVILFWAGSRKRTRAVVR